MNGPTSIFGPDGWIVQKMNYRDGLPNGEMLTYRNGNVETRSSYMNGNLEGEFITYNETAAVIGKAQYSKGSSRANPCGSIRKDKS